MNPYEQRMRDEVIYLHSLWHQGSLDNPSPNSISASLENLHVSNSASSSKHYPNRRYTHNPSRNLHVTKPTTPFKKSRPGTNNGKNHLPVGFGPSPTFVDSGPEWPVNPPPPQKPSVWPVLKPHSAPVTGPVSAQEQAKFEAMQMHHRVLETCREFFAKRIDLDGDEEDENEDSDDEDEDYLVDTDGTEESKEFKFFRGMFVKNCELRSYYEKNYENGDFCCFVCGGIGEKVGKKFKDCAGLVQHSMAISKTKKRRAHRGFGQVICRVLGWDVDRLPMIVVKGEPLGRSLANSRETQAPWKKDGIAN